MQEQFETLFHFRRTRPFLHTPEWRGLPGRKFGDKHRFIAHRGTLLQPILNHRHALGHQPHETLFVSFATHSQPSQRSVVSFHQITDAQPSYGGYSGAPANEKITWGKLEPTTPRFEINSDAAIVGPLICSWVLGD